MTLPAQPQAHRSLIMGPVRAVASGAERQPDLLPVGVESAHWDCLRTVAPPIPQGPFLGEISGTESGNHSSKFAWPIPVLGISACSSRIRRVFRTAGTPVLDSGTTTSNARDSG